MVPLLFCSPPWEKSEPPSDRFQYLRSDLRVRSHEVENILDSELGSLLLFFLENFYSTECSVGELKQSPQRKYICSFFKRLDKKRRKSNLKNPFVLVNKIALWFCSQWAEQIVEPRDCEASSRDRDEYRVIFLQLLIVFELSKRRLGRGGSDKSPQQIVIIWLLNLSILIRDGALKVPHLSRRKLLKQHLRVFKHCCEVDEEITTWSKYSQPFVKESWRIWTDVTTMPSHFKKSWCVGRAFRVSPFTIQSFTWIRWSSKAALHTPSDNSDRKPEKLWCHLIREITQLPAQTTSNCTKIVTLPAVLWNHKSSQTYVNTTYVYTDQ